MSAESVLQAALLAALRGDATLAAGLNGVFEGAAVKASLPFAELGEVLAVDWGTKTAAGREIRVAVTVRGAGDTGAAVSALAGMVGTVIEAVPRDLAGWRVASVVLLRTRLLRGGPGAWAAVVEYRVRMLAV
jgi:hypothetical protein